MKHYSQLTLEQRYIIYSMLKIGLTQLKIAEVIGVHKSTISRENKWVDEEEFEYIHQS
ncbi:MAG: helix-turn-helix domain-containing protein [Candidatus Marinimicrobia bacterium]|nr:helix-turn-helix domain-containing protein [Candidatus Neomarinimicrobiota bacterium]